MLAARDCLCGAVHSFPGRPIICTGFVCRARSRPGFLPERASLSRKVLSCWSSSCQYLLGTTSSRSPLCLNSANNWGARFSRPAFNSPVLGGSISVVFCCDGPLLVTYCFLVVSWPWSLSSWSVWSSLLNRNMAGMLEKHTQQLVN